MKALCRTALAVLALGAAGLAATHFLLDAELLRDAIAARLEAALGEPVELGAVDLSLFPLPAARIRDVRIGTPPAFRVEAPELRAGVSLAALLTGRIVLRSLELDAPRVRLPESALGSTWKSSRAAPPGIQLAITQLTVRDGRLELGSLALERVSLRGSLGVSREAELAFAAELPGIGRVEAGKLELADLGRDVAQWRWNASAKLADLDLAELRRRFALPAMWGSADGTISGSGRGASAESVAVALESGDLDLKSALLRFTGRTRLDARFPGAIALDLTDAALALGQSLEKPAGVPLKLTATLAEPARALRFGGLRVESDALRAQGELDLGGPSPILDLHPASLDFSALGSWTAPARTPRAGRIELASARISGNPLELRAAGELANVEVPVTPKLTLRVSGPASTDGTLLRSDDLRVAFAGEEIRAAIAYDWLQPSVRLTARAQGARIGPLAEALWNRSDISGRLYARLELAGALAPATLSGVGEFELQDGQLPNISMARAAGLERSLDEPPGLDRFAKLSGRFETAGDHLDVSEVTLVQEYVTAALEGKFWLDGMRADLSGLVQLDFPELGGPSVRPILRVGGPLDALEIEISEAQTDDVREMEAKLIKAIRRSERRERREHKQRGEAHGSDG